MAVSPDETGVILNLSVTVKPGEGRILEDTYHLIGFDFQESHHTAVRVASDLCEEISLDEDGIGINGADIIFEVSSGLQNDVQISAVDGPSARAAATLALIAAVQDKSLKSDGFIEPEGRGGDHFVHRSDIESGPLNEGLNALVFIEVFKLRKPYFPLAHFRCFAPPLV